MRPRSFSPLHAKEEEWSQEPPQRLSMSAGTRNTSHHRATPIFHPHNMYSRHGANLHNSGGGVGSDPVTPLGAPSPYVPPCPMEPVRAPHTFDHRRRYPAIPIDSWEFRKLAPEGSVFPNAMVVWDVDRDGVEEVVMGTTEGSVLVVKPDCRAPIFTHTVSATISVVLYSEAHRRLVLVTLEGQCEVFENFLSSAAATSAAAAAAAGVNECDISSRASTTAFVPSMAGSSPTSAPAAQHHQHHNHLSRKTMEQVTSMNSLYTSGDATSISAAAGGITGTMTAQPDRVFRVASNCMCGGLSTERDSDRLFLGSHDRRLYVYSLSTGACLVSLFVHDPITSVKCFSIPSTTSSTTSSSSRTGEEEGEKEKEKGGEGVGATGRAAAPSLTQNKAISQQHEPSQPPPIASSCIAEGINDDSGAEAAHPHLHNVRCSSTLTPMPEEDRYVPLVLIATPRTLALLSASYADVLAWRAMQDCVQHPLTMTNAHAPQFLGSVDGAPARSTRSFTPADKTTGHKEAQVFTTTTTVGVVSSFTAATTNVSSLSTSLLAATQPQQSNSVGAAAATPSLLPSSDHPLTAAAAADDTAATIPTPTPVVTTTMPSPNTKGTSSTNNTTSAAAAAAGQGDVCPLFLLRIGTNSLEVVPTQQQASGTSAPHSIATPGTSDVIVSAPTTHRSGGGGGRRPRSNATATRSDPASQPSPLSGQQPVMSQPEGDYANATIMIGGTPIIGTPDVLRLASSLQLGIENTSMDSKSASSSYFGGRDRLITGGQREDPLMGGPVQTGGLQQLSQYSHQQGGEASLQSPLAPGVTEGDVLHLPVSIDVALSRSRVIIAAVSEDGFAFVLSMAMHASASTATAPVSSLCRSEAAVEVPAAEAVLQQQQQQQQCRSGTAAVSTAKVPLKAQLLISRPSSMAADCSTLGVAGTPVMVLYNRCKTSEEQQQQRMVRSSHSIRVPPPLHASALAAVITPSGAGMGTSSGRASRGLSRAARRRQQQQQQQQQSQQQSSQQQQAQHSEGGLFPNSLAAVASIQLVQQYQRQQLCSAAHLSTVCTWAGYLGSSSLLVQRVRVFRASENDFCVLFVATDGTCYMVDADTNSVVECKVKPDCSSFTVAAGGSSTSPYELTPAQPDQAALYRAATAAAAAAAAAATTVPGMSVRSPDSPSQHIVPVLQQKQQQQQQQQVMGTSFLPTPNTHARLLRGSVGRMISCVCVSVDELCIYAVGELSLSSTAARRNNNATEAATGVSLEDGEEEFVDVKEEYAVLLKLGRLLAELDGSNNSVGDAETYVQRARALVAHGYRLEEWNMLAGLEASLEFQS